MCIRAKIENKLISNYVKYAPNVILVFFDHAETSLLELEPGLYVYSATSLSRVLEQYIIISSKQVVVCQRTDVTYPYITQHIIQVGIQTSSN